MNGKRLSGYCRRWLAILTLGFFGLSSHVAAQDTETYPPDFTQFERLSELRSCKRMEKELQSVLSDIEKERQQKGIATRVLWVDLYNTGYCDALPVPLTGLGQPLLDRFPKEIPFGFRTASWNLAQQDAIWSPPYASDDVWSLITLYLDKKNKTIYWMEYKFTDSSTPFRMWGTGPQGELSEQTYNPVIAKPLIEKHYSHLLDDLDAMARAGRRDWMLMEQIQMMQNWVKRYSLTYFNEDYSMLLANEGERRGDLLKILKEKAPVSTWDQARSKAEEQVQALMQAQDKAEPAFAQIERVTKLKPCKQMDKVFQPVFKRIEEGRKAEGLDYKNQTLWVDLGNTGYCDALQVLQTERGQAVSKRFPQEIPYGVTMVHWDPMLRTAETDTPYDVDEVQELITIYFDKKNNIYYRLVYAFSNAVRPSAPFTVWKVKENAGIDFLSAPDEKRFFEFHYRRLLDDLATAAKAGHKDKLLMLQILKMQEHLTEKYQDSAFLEVEHKQRGELMKVFDGVQVDDLDNDGWLTSLD